MLSISNFCHIFGRGSGRRSSRTLFIIIDWHPSVLETLKPFVGLRLAYSIITKCFFKHSVCFRNRLAEFEAEFDANPLLIHISHFSRSVRSQNSTNMTSQKCTDKTHTTSQQNAAWQSVHKGYSWRYLVAHNCTISSFRAAFQFRGLLVSTSCVWNCAFWSCKDVHTQPT